MGDSKTDLMYNEWPTVLIDSLGVLDNPLEWSLRTPTWLLAQSGAHIDLIRANVDSALRNFDNTPSARNVFLCNIGRNDAATADSTEWVNDYIYVINAMIAKWPDIEIFIAKPWGRTLTTYCNTMAGWIDVIVALYPANCKAGHDERVWLEGGDDGATMTFDGTHYSVAGQAECVNQWKTILGY